MVGGERKGRENGKYVKRRMMREARWVWNEREVEEYADMKVRGGRRKEAQRKVRKTRKR